MFHAAEFESVASACAYTPDCAAPEDSCEGLGFMPRPACDRGAGMPNAGRASSCARDDAMSGVDARLHAPAASGLMDLIESWFADAWFTADALGTCLAQVQAITDGDEPPHMPYLVAADWLARLSAPRSNRAAGRLEESPVLRGTWRLVCMSASA